MTAYRIEPDYTILPGEHGEWVGICRNLMASTAHTRVPHTQRSCDRSRHLGSVIQTAEITIALFALVRSSSFLLLFLRFAGTLEPIRKERGQRKEDWEWDTTPLHPGRRIFPLLEFLGMNASLHHRLVESDPSIPNIQPSPLLRLILMKGDFWCLSRRPWREHKKKTRHESWKGEGGRKWAWCMVYGLQWFHSLVAAIVRH